MKLLFDTHIILWSLEAPETLSPEFQRAMSQGAVAVASVASLWEIAIKVAKGKIRAPVDLPRLLVQAGFEMLPVSARHAWEVRSSARVLATSDSFDRLIHAQAKVEGLTLATRDAALLRSGVDVMAA